MVLSDEILSQPLLLVGCGGIGCEVIKNLLLIGFNNIQMIDLDTIDVSNLNRQFLFNKTHINQSKALVSAKVASNLFANGRENLNIKPIHGSILNSDYDVEYFKSFSLVINALDNRQARSHVNRMCLAADVPLIESGTEGYLGQTFVIKKNITACYECSGPTVDQKTFASCTIRNTPSQPIHCIVWGKHLFNQLFGEDDPDNDVSPDMNDPELTNLTSNDKENMDEDIENSNLNSNENGTSTNNKFPSTRKWAESNNYDPLLLFDKLFRIDIEYLHKMDKLWKNRTKPIILKYDQLDVELPKSSRIDNDSSTSTYQEDYSLKDQKLLSLRECFELFVDSLKQLKERLKTDQYLVWDKDDEAALDFVTAVSNLRSLCFHIERKSKFDVKSMAGNIIPAISSTNSIIGGLMVLQLINLLKKLSALTEEQKLNKKEVANLFKSTVKQIFLRRVSTNVGNLIAAYDCFEQNPKCMVCCTKHIPEIEVKLNMKQITMHELVEQFIFKKLNFVCPDIQLDGQPTIIWSKDDYEEFSEKDKEEYKTKFLINYPLIKDKVRLKVYDLLQNMSVIITLFDEEFTLNENGGLFYKMKITSDVDEKEIEDENGQASSHSTKVLDSKSNSASSSNSLDNGNDDKIVENNIDSSDAIDLSNDKKDPQLNRQDKIDLEPTTVDNQSTNGKSNEKINGNHNKVDKSEEIVLLDSDEEIDDQLMDHKNDNQKVQTKNKESDSFVEVLDDDDDDIQMIDCRETNEKRKFIELDGEDDHSTKKLRFENSNV